MVRSAKSAGRNRRGAAYLLVLTVSMLASLFVMAGLMSVSIGRRQQLDHRSRLQAQLHARAAVGIALQRIEAQPTTWRREFAKDKWSAKRRIGSRRSPDSYSFVAADPVDGDLLDSPRDPVELVGIGRSGPALQRLKVRIEFRRDIKALTAKLVPGSLRPD